MNTEDIIRKDLDDEQFRKLRQNTDKITSSLDKRLKGHLDVLGPLFAPKKLLGAYIKSTTMEDMPDSDKAYAALQEQYAAICEKPFGLARKLTPPLPPISSKLDATRFKYALKTGESEDKATTITAATRWIVSYRTDCPYTRLKAMLLGEETRQPDDMKQSLIDHLSLVVFLKRFPALTKLFLDLRYEVEIIKMEELGGLPVVLLKALMESFLPPDDFIVQVTQLSGIPAFQEILDLDAVDNMLDPLKDALKGSVKA
jgi:hypothetical protein